jgi:Cof subfamily protein (haloacid dehalogenase superfamily)
MKHKAIIFDIDGTAIDSPGQRLPTDRLVNAIRAAEGQYFLCAATGRVWTFAKPFLKSLDLMDPCIISGGTQICNPKSGEILWQCNVEPTAIDEVVKIIKKHPEYKVLYNDYSMDAYLHGGIAPADLHINQPVYFLEITFIPEEIAPQIIDELLKVEGIAVTLVVAMRPGFKDIHVTNKDATKEHAIAELITALGIKQEDTIGVGDGHNDLHLFNAVSYKVAMGNAVEELKAEADEIIGHVANDSFTEYLERLANRSRSNP